jgi:hypothetical protein
VAGAVSSVTGHFPLGSSMANRSNARFDKDYPTPVAVAFSTVERVADERSTHELNQKLEDKCPLSEQNDSGRLLGAKRAKSKEIDASGQ